MDEKALSLVKQHIITNVIPREEKDIDRDSITVSIISKHTVLQNTEYIIKCSYESDSIFIVAYDGSHKWWYLDCYTKKYDYLILN